VILMKLTAEQAEKLEKLLAELRVRRLLIAGLESNDEIWVSDYALGVNVTLPQDARRGVRVVTERRCAALKEELARFDIEVEELVPSPRDDSEEHALVPDEHASAGK
jgi:hypothetical protein